MLRTKNAEDIFLELEHWDYSIECVRVVRDIQMGDFPNEAYGNVCYGGITVPVITFNWDVPSERQWIDCLPQNA